MTQDWTETRPEPTATALKRLCHVHGIQNAADAVYMDEFTLGDRRVDVLTIDLQKMMIRGFEIKVSRADFVGDDKWTEYLRFVNYFFFVTVPGLVQPSELPPEVFLMEWTVEERDRWGKKEYRPALKLVKRGKKLQPRFVRETYGEHFFHKTLLSYVRNLRWRAERLNKLCSACAGPLLDNPDAARSQTA